MTTQVFEGSQLKRFIRRLLLAFAFPLVSGILAFLQLSEQQPYWGGRENDPSYAYLLNSLNIATFFPPNHTDHPGTPIQEIGALVLRAMHLRENSAQLARSILSNPERHAHAISIVLISIALFSSAASGLWALSRTGRISAVLATQLGPLLVPGLLAGYSGVRPEPLLLACGHVWIAMAIVWSEGHLDFSRRTAWIGFAMLGGLSVAIKYTAAPLLFLPLTIISGWRARLKFVAVSIATFILIISPALPRWRQLSSWVFRLATHDGVYGTGAFAFGPREGWLNAIWETVSANVEYTILCGAVSLAVVASLRQRSSGEQFWRQERLTLAVAATLCAALMMVTKQAGSSSRYLLAAASILPLGAYALWRSYGSRLRAGVRFGVIALLGAGSLAMAVHGTVNQLRTVLAERHTADGVKEWKSRNLSNELVVPYYGASSIPFALAGADPSYEHWGTLLSTLYPDFIFYDVWIGEFRSNFSRGACPAPRGIIFLQGAPLDGNELLGVKRPKMKWLTTEIWRDRTEAIYRVDTMSPR